METGLEPPGFSHGEIQPGDPASRRRSETGPGDTTLWACLAVVAAMAIAFAVVFGLKLSPMS
jgi:hypothetical protein